MRLPTLAVLLGLALPAAGCSGLLFYPEPGLRLTPDRLGLVYEDRHVASGDERLHGWLLPARGPSRASVVFFHGNAENISTHIGSVAWLPGAGFSVLLVDYRGFGLSTGSPDLEGPHRDARAVLRAARGDPALDPDRLIVFGQSLGGAIALPAIASLRDEIPVRAAILDSAPSDYREITRDVLERPWLTRWFRVPLSMLVPASPRPLDALAELPELPVLMVHGVSDPIVPPRHSEALHRAAGPRAELWLVPGAGHIEVFHRPVWRDLFVRFVDAILEPAPDARAQDRSAREPEPSG